MTSLINTTIAVLVLVTGSVFGGTGIPGVQSGAKKYTMNNAVGKNGIEFISDAPMEQIKGTSDGVGGSFMLDAANLEATSGRIDVQVLTMKTANSKRDGHMYGESWLDAAKHPTISFDVKSLKDVKVSTKDGKSTVTATAVGLFTCHGIAKAANATITMIYIAESAETQKRATGNLVMVEAAFNVNLADHQIVGRAGMIGKDVGETIVIRAKLFANS